MAAAVPVLVMSAGLLEAIDLTEYAALSDDNKEVVKICLSCGTVNLAIGSQARSLLTAIFPVGTATSTAISQLVGVPEG